MRRPIAWAAALALGGLAPGCGAPGPPHADEAAAEGASARTGDDGPSARDRERTLEFWRVYREAQQDRLAGRWVEAAAAYRRALRLDPEHEGAHYGLANCLLETDGYEEARQHLLRLVELNPLSRRAHVQLGLVHSSPNAACCFDLDAAEAALERALEINAEETGALLRLAEIALARGQGERAARLLELAQQANSGSAEARYLRAYLAWTDGRPAEAARLLSRLLAHAAAAAAPRGVPGEGDTKRDLGSLPSTLEDKLLVPPLWDSVGSRLAPDRLDEAALAEEFGPLADRFAELRRRGPAQSSKSGRNSP